MKILVISTCVFRVPPPGYSGLEQIAWQTACGLGDLGHDVTLAAPEGSYGLNCSIHVTGPEGKFDEREAYWGYRDKLHEFDAIIDHSWNKWAYEAKAYGLKTPVLGVCHAPVNTMFQSLPPGVDKPCFVCISKDQADHFQALFGRQAMVCHNGIDLNFYKPIQTERSKRFLFLARFSTIKGADIAIEACRRAKVGLDLVGDTSITNEPEFLKKCVDMADGEQIKIHGNATRGECVWWYSQAHCLLHPNKRFREPFGLAPVEAMACGCPVIGWRYGALTETVKEGESGWLVNDESNLLKCIESMNHDYGICDAMRESSVKQASKFSVENMVKRYADLCHIAIVDGGW